MFGHAWWTLLLPSSLQGRPRDLRLAGILLILLVRTAGSNVVKMMLSCVLSVMKGPKPIR